MNKEFLIYCNTRQFLTNHWKGEIFSNAFYLSDKQLQSWKLTRAQVEALPEIITVVDSENGRVNYNVEGIDTIDLSLVRASGQPLTDLHKWLLDRVLESELPEGIESTPYWKVFIKHRDNYPELFFKVDWFAGRVHTPISGMSKTIRPHLLLQGEETSSLDVVQMQPLLLGRVLFDQVGKNSFSDAISAGKDIYEELQTKSGLATREQGKDKFYSIFYGKPDDKISKLFENEEWIEWINWYKSTPEPRNPRGEKIYNNLAWLLQNLEVDLMEEVWRALAEKAIPFLTVHDEIIFKKSDTGRVETIFNNILSKHFKTYKISIK